MALNLRTIGPVLHADLKSAAAKAGKSLEFFCILLLREALTARGGSSVVERRGTVTAQVVSTTPSVAGSNPAPRSKPMDDFDTVQGVRQLKPKGKATPFKITKATVRKFKQRTDTALGEYDPPKTEFGRIANQIDALIAEGRPKHDVKTCRVYRCGACRAAKG